MFSIYLAFLTEFSYKDPKWGKIEICLVSKKGLKLTKISRNSPNNFHNWLYLKMPWSVFL